MFRHRVAARAKRQGGRLFRKTGAIVPFRRAGTSEALLLGGDRWFAPWHPPEVLHRDFSSSPGPGKRGCQGQRFNE